MADGPNPMLSYETSPTTMTRPRLAIASITTAVFSVLFGFGGIFLFAFLTRNVRNRPTDLDYIPLQLTSVAAILLGPPVGMILGIIALRKRTPQKRLAVLGLVLNAAVWGIPVAIGLARMI